MSRVIICLLLTPASQVEDGDLVLVEKKER